MKKNFVIISLIICISSCNSNNTSPGKERVIGAIPLADTVRPNRFANVKFISRYDTSCGMPLAAGLEDILHYKGNIYGFCSKECKDDFIAKQTKQNKK